MEDPYSEISSVVHQLTQTPPAAQREAIERYYTRDASFTHPFCRTGSWELSETVNSRAALAAIYRWYKIMSPRVDLRVNSVAYNVQTQTLYVDIAQVFRVWIVPFYAASVRLVTVLKLVQDKQTRLYLIQAQEDLYQLNEIVRFFWFGGSAVVWVLQVLCTMLCALGAALAWPQVWVEDRVGRGWIGVAARSKIP